MKGFRRFLETLLLFFCAVLIFRAVGAEPYGVPTGSMAPTLLGHHKAVVCPRCGYPVRVGSPGEPGDPHAVPPVGAACPNCGCPDLGLDSAPVCPGDHVLVNKNLYEWRTPRRWEMAVFLSPIDQGKVFVKRVVGLPGESVQVRDGDVYIDHEIARKTLDELKALRIPVFDNTCQPADGGWAVRWQMQPDRGPVPRDGPRCAWRPRASPTPTSGSSTATPSPPPTKPARFSTNMPITAATPRAPEPVHDFMLECDLEVYSGDGWLALGLNDGGSAVVAELPVGALKDGTHLGEWPADGGAATVYRTAPTFGLKVGTTYHVEFAFVDRRATLAVDGRQPFAPVDRPALPSRDEVVKPARIGGAASRRSYTTSGCSATCITRRRGGTRCGACPPGGGSVLCAGGQQPQLGRRPLLVGCRRPAAARRRGGLPGQAVPAAPPQPHGRGARRPGRAARRLGSRALAALTPASRRACPEGQTAGTSPAARREFVLAGPAPGRDDSEVRKRSDNHRCFMADDNIQRPPETFPPAPAARPTRPRRPPLPRPPPAPRAEMTAAGRSETEQFLRLGAGLVLVLLMGWGLIAGVGFAAYRANVPLEMGTVVALAVVLSLGLFILLERNLWLSRFMGLRTVANTSPYKEAFFLWLLGVPGLLWRSTEGRDAAPATDQKTQSDVSNTREVIETVVFVVVLVLLLKSFVAEAFVIPTGSMATTLYGYQKQVTCPKCGHEFPVNCSQEVDPQEGDRVVITGCTCPNCRFPIELAKEEKVTERDPRTGQRMERTEWSP